MNALNSKDVRFEKRGAKDINNKRDRNRQDGSDSENVITTVSNTRHHGMLKKSWQLELQFIGVGTATKRSITKRLCHLT